MDEAEQCCAYIGWVSQATMDAQEQQKALIRRNAELAKVSI